MYICDVMTQLHGVKAVPSLHIEDHVEVGSIFCIQLFSESVMAAVEEMRSRLSHHSTNNDSSSKPGRYNTVCFIGIYHSTVPSD